MIGIPWVVLKDELALQGQFPLLGFPPGIDPMDCMFVMEKNVTYAIKSQVYVAKRLPKSMEWENLLLP